MLGICSMNCTGDQEIGDVCPIFYSGSIVSTVKLLHTNFQFIILKIVVSPGFEKLSRRISPLTTGLLKPRSFLRVRSFKNVLRYVGFGAFLFVTFCNFTCRFLFNSRCRTKLLKVGKQYCSRNDSF